MSLTRRTLLGSAALAPLLPAPLLTAAARAATPLRIGIQPGLTYLPLVVAEHEKLIERRAKALGIDDLAVTWSRVAGGNVLNDALLSGSLDCAATGFPSFLILWSKGRGKLAIKGLVSYGNAPLFLLSRNPAVKSIRDLGDSDRITVPAVKSSLQAILLQMAAEKLWGQWDKLDHLTVSRSHPDALAALLSKSEIDCAFSAPPYQYQALEHPEIHVVTTSDDIFGGPCSNGLLYMTESFHDANPVVAKAINQAVRDAVALVTKDPAAAADMYLATSGEKIDPALVRETVTAPGTVFEAVPRGLMRFAEFMKRTGAISRTPATWQDAYFPEAADLSGS